MRFPNATAAVFGATLGGFLLAGVGSITQLEVIGGCVGAVFGAVVGVAFWTGRVSVLTIGGIVGAAFISSVSCPPSGLAAP